MVSALTEKCPVCGADLDPNMGAPYTWWCAECEMEYWREDDWYCCGVDGEARSVDTDTDR